MAEYPMEMRLRLGQLQAQATRFQPVNPKPTIKRPGFHAYYKHPVLLLSSDPDKI